MTTFLDSNLFTWVILPALIFFARICDMSLDTMRIIMIGRGSKVLAAVLGFFEVCIWLLVARQVITHLPNPLCFFAYAGGFAVGNYVGVVIEEKMASGAQMVRVVMREDPAMLMSELARNSFGVTHMPGRGVTGGVNIIFTTIDRKDLERVLKIVHRASPGAFYTVEDVRLVSEGVFPARRPHNFFRFLQRK
jgi:uncharacterized protein YebE (UPF0316 family)